MNNNFSKKIEIKRKIFALYLKVKYFLGISFSIFLIIFIFSNFFHSWKAKLKNFFIESTVKNGFVLESIYVENLQNLTLLDIDRLLKIEKGYPIFTIDLHILYEKLMSHPLIEDVILEKRLPNILYISLKESAIVALWQFRGKLSLINDVGEIVYFNDFSKFNNLPYVLGEDANLYAHELIENMYLYPSLYSKLKYSVRVGKRRWDLIFENGFRIQMPEKNFQFVLNYLNDFLQKTNYLNSKYKILDARDSQKFYLKRN